MLLSVVTNLAILAFGIALLIQSYQIRALRFGGSMGGDVFPKWFAAVLITLAVALLLVDIIGYFRNRTAKAPEALTDRRLPPGSLQVAAFLGAFIVHIGLLPLVGFVPAVIPLIFANFLLLKTGIKGKDWLSGLLYSAGVTFAFWLIFEKLFQIVLPRGILF